MKKALKPAPKPKEAKASSKELAQLAELKEENAAMKRDLATVKKLVGSVSMAAAKAAAVKDEPKPKAKAKSKGDTKKGKNGAGAPDWDSGWKDSYNSWDAPK